MEADRAALMVPEVLGLRSVSAAGPIASDAPPPAHIPSGQGLSGLALDQGKSVLGNDYAQHPMALPRAVEQGINSMVVLPVSVTGRVLGVITVASTRRDHFTPDRMRMLTSIVDSMGVLLEHSRLLRIERQRSEEVETLYAIAKALAEPGKFPEKAARVLEEVIKGTGGDFAALVVPDEAGADLQCIATAGPSNVGPDDVEPMPLRGSMAGTAFLQRVTMVANDVDASPDAAPSQGPSGGDAGSNGSAHEAGDARETGGIPQPGGIRARSVAALPIQADGETLGAITVTSGSANHFTPDRVRFLTAVGEAVGTLIQNARLNQEVSAALEREYRRIEAFQTASARLALETSPDQAMQYMVDVVRELVGAGYGAMAVWDHEGEVSQLVSSGTADSGPSEESLNALRASEVLGLVHFALVREQKKGIRVGDSGRTKKLHAGDGPPLHSLLGVPFSRKDGSPAAFFLMEKESGPAFSDDDERLLNLFAVLAGVLLDNIQLYSDVERERTYPDEYPDEYGRGLGGTEGRW